MMYFFKTLACFNLLKVQVLHMLCTLKLKGVLHFPLKGLYQMLSRVHFCLWHCCDSPSCSVPGTADVSTAVKHNRGVLCGCCAPFCPLWVRSKTAKGALQHSPGAEPKSASEQNNSDIAYLLFSVILHVLEDIVFNSILAFCSPSNRAKCWVFFNYMFLINNDEFS